ncbi:uncharacterized protein JCM15063_000300 [Sporobolomyces koalae]|uniref:uncharacterized protein n=1 Tax=Sporobolomyces koalae TaxID=500713 RepID=UPI0031826B00
MASTAATRDRSPAPRKARIARPPPARSTSLIAAPTLSHLTTRSSSASRLYTRDYPIATDPVAAANADQDYRASYSPRPDNKSRRAADNSGTSDGKGKDRALSFVVGIASSSDEGDALVERNLPTLTPSDGTRARRSNTSSDGSDLASDPVSKAEASIQEIIRSQIRQPIRHVDSLDLDSLLPYGVGDYSFVLQQPKSARSSLSHIAQSGDDEEDRPDRISMGKGKFSEVLLVRKGDTQFALKHTPLHPHHPLIASRLLREPTILAQLRPHPNLVKVFETIRTPGHFYLVEESLCDWITLEAFVASSPGGILSVSHAWSILQQLSSVVHSLHEPLRVAHRDIKPENILIRVVPSSGADNESTILLKLLDFGLATHFSASEPKLTTCCGSPAYHSPELWKGLREPSGTVPYWGPEIDIWCCGLTLLRCLSPTKYPIGTSHASYQAISDKVIDALLAVRDPSIRQVLAGFLQMSGRKRIKAFEQYCRTLAEYETVPEEKENQAGPVQVKEFKSTTFIPAELTHRLELPLDATLAMTAGPKLEATIVDDEFHFPSAPASLERSDASPACREQVDSSNSPSLSPKMVLACTAPLPAGCAPIGSRSPLLPPTPKISLHPASCSDSLPPTPIAPASDAQHLHHLAYPPPIEVVLLNPTNEPVRRAVSYVKYSLRCAGVLYHVRDDTLSLASRLTPASELNESPAIIPPTPFAGSFNLPTSPPACDDDFCSYLECVARLPATPESSSKASSALIAALRPPLARAHTTEPASTLKPPDPSVPVASVKLGQREKETVEALTFHMSIRKVWISAAPSRSRSKTRAHRRNSKDSRIVITLSDDRALTLIRNALSVVSDTSVVPPPLVPLAESASTNGERGRQEGRTRKTGSPPGRSGALDQHGQDEPQSAAATAKPEAAGLKMEMGPRRSFDEGKGGGVLFGFAGLVGRLVGNGSSSSLSLPADRRE